MIKLSKITKVCKDNGQAIIYSIRGNQWIGAGCGYYPLYGMPVVDEETIKPVLSLTEKEAEKMQIEEAFPPNAFSFNDSESSDIILNAPILKFIQDERQYNAYTVKQKDGECRLIIVDAGYLKPFADCDEEPQLVYRMTNEWEYIAVMDGMLITGLVVPAYIDKKKLKESLAAVEVLLSFEG